jgi:hypothetical protein
MKFADTKGCVMTETGGNIHLTPVKRHTLFPSSHDVIVRSMKPDKWPSHLG